MFVGQTEIHVSSESVGLSHKVRSNWRDSCTKLTQRLRSISHPCLLQYDNNYNCVAQNRKPHPRHGRTHRSSLAHRIDINIEWGGLYYKHEICSDAHYYYSARLLALLYSGIRTSRHHTTSSRRDHVAAPSLAHAADAATVSGCSRHRGTVRPTTEVSGVRMH